MSADTGSPDARKAVDRTRVAARLATGVLVFLTLAALTVTILIAVVAGQPPDGFREPVFGDQRPVPYPPRSWAETQGAVERATVAALGVGVLATASVGLRRYAVDGTLLSRRQSLAVLATPPIVMVAVLALVLGVNRDAARLRPDCEAFRFDRAAFRAPDRDRWEPQVIGLRECGLLVGRRASQVRRLLGTPDPSIVGQPRNLWVFHDGAFSVGFNSLRAQELYP